jgi:peptidyl-prolyl cis-trans isomerase A (cyclophilin A)
MRLKTILMAAAAAALLAAGADAVAAPEKLMKPEALTAKAPDVFKAKFETTAGNFVVEVHRDWAPNGADRFYNLVKNGYYDGVKFFRVIPGFMAQFGISGDPSIAMTWLKSNIQDDPVKQSNKRSFVTFAQTSSPNTRSVQLFINYGDNSRLDAQRFAPFGKVIEGMESVDKLYSGYDANTLSSLQGRIADEGNAFLEKEYPKLDGIKKATIE